MTIISQLLLQRLQINNLHLVFISINDRLLSIRYKNGGSLGADGRVDEDLQVVDVDQVLYHYFAVVCQLLHVLGALVAQV
jgi:hypothetical protein